MKKLFSTMFKKTETVEERKTSKEYPEEVKKIHKEFNCAGDEILAEAMDLLKKAEAKDVKKGLRISSLGFKNVPQALEAIEVSNKVEMAKSTAEIIKYYSQKYPLYRFITEEKIESICNKYNLVFGEAADYKGFMPTKNLEEIEKFVKSKGIDLEDKQVLIDDGRFNWRPWEKTHKDALAILKKRYGSVVLESFYSSDERKGIICDELGSHVALRCPNDSFKICAPLKDMDTTGKKLEKHKLIKHIPDPIVLSPVRHGYLIITAWGDEASDEDVVNNIMN